MKKLVLLVFLLIFIPVLSINAQNITSKPEIVIVNPDLDLPEDSINIIIKEILNDYPSAGRVNIHSFESANHSVSIEENIILDEKTDGFFNNIIGKKAIKQTIASKKIITNPLVFTSENAIISVSKAEVVKNLPEELKFQLTSTYTGELSSKSFFGSTANLSVTFPTFEEFDGSISEDDLTNREYKVRFYNEEGFYIQDKKIEFNLGKAEESSIDGTYVRPSCYIVYSIDLP